MPVSYTKSGGQGHVYQVPDYPETADGPKAFKDFADFLDLILPPVGTIMPFVGSTAPTGWLLCEGQEVSSTTYPKLSAVCGTKFGTASAGSFRLPNLKGRVIAGLDASQTEFDTIGKTGGAKNVTLTVSNMPAHTHTTPAHDHTANLTGGTVIGTTGADAAHTHPQSGTFTSSTDPGHSHDTRVNDASNFDRTGSGSGAVWVGTNTGNSTASGGSHSHTVTLSGNTGAGSSHTHSFSGSLTGATIAIPSGGAGTSGSAGSGTAVTTLDPYITMNHIIRAA